MPRRHSRSHAGEAGDGALGPVAAKAPEVSRIRHSAATIFMLFLLLALQRAAPALSDGNRSRLLVRARRRRRTTFTGRRPSPRRPAAKATRPEHPRRVSL